MGVIRPIPKKLLIHNVEKPPVVSKDKWGKETLGEAVTLTSVRVEPSTKVMRDKNSAEVQLAAVLFYDCRNSRPLGHSFKPDEIITFNGESHRIVTVEPLYDNKKLHHYEMGLVRHAKN